MVLRKSERADVSGLRAPPGGLDLLEDLHRQRRRRTLRRAAWSAALALGLLGVGIGFKQLADRRDADVALDTASIQVHSGTMSDLESAAAVLEASEERNASEPALRSALALVRAHLWAEFGVASEAAHAAVRAAPTGSARQLAEALVAFGDGRIEEAANQLERVGTGEAGRVRGLIDDLVAQESAWLAAMLGIARREPPPELDATLEPLERACRDYPRNVVLKRAKARLLMAHGRAEKALEELQRARDLSRGHLGLAADEALYNALLHRELGGVASVADQLMAMQEQGVAPPDLANARLARAVAHVRSGEPEAAVALLEQAWPHLPAWDLGPRRLAVETALEAGQGERTSAWLPESGLSPSEREIYGAWATLLRGEVMEALEQLEKLPQEHALVGYLQALALVEQRRFVEAQPWIERTEALLPGRIEIEVARARVELQLGDRKRALRRLKGLAEEEPYAPRAYTGLGEAYLQQTDGDRDLAAAKRILQKAIEREPVPAEAMLLLARVWHEKRNGDSEAEHQALQLLERAAQTNPHLPRYRTELALYLADLGYEMRARELLRTVVKERGVPWPAFVTLVRLELVTNDGAFDPSALLETAAELGADPRILERERARAAMLQNTPASLAEAEAKLRTMLLADETDLDTRVLYGLTRARQHDRKGAKTTIMRGYKLHPEAQHGRLDFALAQVQARFGQRDRAAPRARRAWILMRDEQRPAAELLEVAELATSLWSREGEDRVALAVARDLTSRMSYHHEAWTIRARTELAAGESGAARTSAERAIELDGNHAEAHVIRGHALIRFGHKEEARKAYERAVELAAGTPAERDYREHLARL